MDVTFYIDGIMKAATPVNQIYVDCKVGGAELAAFPYPQDEEQVQANSEYVMKVDVPIPAFAPSGSYDVTLTIQYQPDGQGDPKDLGCLHASFNFA